MEDYSKCSILDLNKKFKENVIVSFDSHSIYISQQELQRNNILEKIESRKSADFTKIINNKHEKNNCNNRSKSIIEHKFKENRNKTNKEFLSLKFKPNILNKKKLNSKISESDIVLTTNSNTEKNCQQQNDKDESDSVKDYLQSVKKREKNIFDILNKIRFLNKSKSKGKENDKYKNKELDKDCNFNTNINTKINQNIVMNGNNFKMDLNDSSREFENISKFPDEVLQKCNYNSEQILSSKFTKTNLEKQKDSKNDSCIIS